MSNMNVSLFPSNEGRNDIVHHPREQWHSCMKKHGFKWGMKNPDEWKNPAGWTLTWIFDSFFTKSEKSSNHFFKNLLNKDQRFKSKGMKKPARGKKNLGEWKNPAR